MTIDRVDPPNSGSEIDVLRGFLNYHRDTLRMKADGLDAQQLNTTLPPSDLTLGGMLKHLAFVEGWWFSVVLHGQQEAEPWASADWDADEDWDWRSAVHDSPLELRELLDRHITESEVLLDQALANGGLDQPAARSPRTGEPFNLRHIVIHMIEEYARHNGHADLIRQSIDGVTGE